MKISSLIVSVLYFVGLGIALANDIPPTDGQPLSKILYALESREGAVITEVEFDDGKWEIKILRMGSFEELYINPKTGATEKRETLRSSIRKLPPDNAKPLSAIVQAVENRGIGAITEIEFDDGVWEVEFRRDGKKVEMDIDPITGEIIRS